jgi:hypothetical protein
MYRILLLFVTIASIVNINYGTPLDDYVNKPDPAFAWKLIKAYPFSTYTIYLLNMTSQQWLDGIIKEIKTVFLKKIIVFSFVLITINLVALYDYHRT